MIRKDGLILPEGIGNRLNLHPLLTVGLTEDMRIGCFWPNEQLQRSLQGRLSVADLQKVKDAILNAVKDSLDKRLPTVINIS